MSWTVVDVLVNVFCALTFEPIGLAVQQSKAQPLDFLNGTADVGNSALRV